MTTSHDASRRRTLAQLSALSLATLSPWALRNAMAQTPLTVGVIYVGPRDDFGYNQAQALAAAKETDVRFSHCGGMWTESKHPKNTGSYFGYIDECQFLTTEVCVQTSMREANDRGYDCLLVEAATESYFPEFKAAALAMIAAQGAIVGWHAPSTTVLAALHAA